MSRTFADSWFSVGTGTGLTAFVPNPTMKLVYWFSYAGATRSQSRAM